MQEIHMYLTLGVLFLASVFFMQGKFRADLIACCALISLLIFGVLEPQEALSGFSNPVVVMMLGLFVVGAGIFRTGLAKMISGRILRLSGGNENLLFVLVLLATASIGAFVSNTGTIAVMMPIVVSMAASANLNPSRYLMPMAFASSLGLFTLISTPPNLVIQEALESAGEGSLSFFSFAPIGAICVVSGLVYLFFASRMLGKNNQSNAKDERRNKSLQELISEYNLEKQTFVVQIPENSALEGKTPADLAIASQYGVSLSKIVRESSSYAHIRKKREEILVGPQTTFHAGDNLYCHAPKQNIEFFIEAFGLTKEEVNRTTLDGFQDSGIAEVYIMSTSNLVNRTIKEVSFRETYNVNVLGVKSKDSYDMYDFQDKKLHAGDALLVQGLWSDLENLANRQDDMVMVGQPLEEASKVTLDQKAPVAALIMLAMILGMTFNVLPSVTCVIVAALAMVLTGCLRNMEEAYKSINWESVVLIGAMLPMSTAFEKTGAAALIADTLVSNLGDLGPYALLAGIYFCTSLLTLFISNTATAVLLAPIALSAAVKMGVSPHPFLFAVAVAASLCFASPFSTPPNALVMNVGGYRFMDYIRVGGPFQLIMGIIMVLSLPLLFPF